MKKKNICILVTLCVFFLSHHVFSDLKIVSSGSLKVEKRKIEVLLESEYVILGRVLTKYSTHMWYYDIEVAGLISGEKKLSKKIRCIGVSPGVYNIGDIGVFL